MSNLKVGYSRANVTPQMGIPISGYYKERFAEGVLDELHVIALALQDENTTAVILTIDHCGLNQQICNNYREIVAKATGLSSENVYIYATHSHTAAEISLESTNELVSKYTEFVGTRMADAAVFALNDLKPAKMGYGKGTAPNVAFIRRYVMKDGSTRTNPGVNNPDIVRPIGATDEEVCVVRFDREGAENIVLVNFGNHPDVVGGSLISADWPGLLVADVEKFLDNTKCIFLNGAQGNVNHVNVHPTGGYLNDMFMDFDDVSRGYGHAEYIARVVLGGVLQAYDKVYYTDNTKLICKNKMLHIPANKADASELPEAHRINDIHNAGKDNELPYEGMMLTTVVARAARIVRLENAPDTFPMPLSAISIGPVAIVGIPGEPFNEIGKGIKASGEFDMIMPNCLANGSEGYFPMQDSFDEGGYEAGSSNFKAGVGELLVKEGITILQELKK